MVGVRCDVGLYEDQAMLEWKRWNDEGIGEEKAKRRDAEVKIAKE